jgi:hypothetical protein
MGRELVNELTWSVSRDRLFRECRRAYYYNYYGSWGGWASDAPERTRKIYILKNMTSLPMWAGSIVHEVIAEALNRYMSKQTPIDAGELKAHATRKLRQGWKDSVERVWEKTPKKTNLAELYYGNGKTLPSEETEKVRNKIDNCLDNWAHSEVLQAMLTVPHLNWKPIDALDSFLLDGLKVWCAIDFAYVGDDGALRILDWKTGAEHEDELRLQLACYALYAGQKWHAPLKSQHLAGVFLDDRARVSEYVLEPDALETTKTTIMISAAQMRLPLVDADKNEACEDDFPVCENERVCTRCNFREVCPYMNG